MTSPLFLFLIEKIYHLKKEMPPKRARNDSSVSWTTAPNPKERNLYPPTLVRAIVCPSPLPSEPQEVLEMVQNPSPKFKVFHLYLWCDASLKDIATTLTKRMNGSKHKRITFYAVPASSQGATKLLGAVPEAEGADTTTTAKETTTLMELKFIPGTAVISVLS